MPPNGSIFLAGNWSHRIHCERNAPSWFQLSLERGSRKKRNRVMGVSIVNEGSSPGPTGRSPGRVVRNRNQKVGTPFSLSCLELYKSYTRTRHRGVSMHSPLAVIRGVHSPPLRVLVCQCRHSLASRLTPPHISVGQSPHTELLTACRNGPTGLNQRWP